MATPTTGITNLASIAQLHLQYFQSTIRAYEGHDLKVATILRDLEIAVRAADTTQRILRDTKLPHDAELCQLHTRCAGLIDTLGLQLRSIRKRVFCCAIIPEKYPFYLAKLRKDRELDKMRADLRDCEKKIASRLAVLLAGKRCHTRALRRRMELADSGPRLRHHNSADSIRSLEERIEVFGLALENGRLSKGSALG